MKILQIGSSLPGSGGIEKFLLHLSEGLRERQHEVHIAARPDAWLWKQAQERGFTLQPLTVAHTHDFRAFAPCRRLFAAGRYDIIATHFSPDYLVPALAARLTGQRGLVLTRHVVGRWRPYKGWLYGKALYPRLIGVSEAVRTALLQSGIAPERVVTVHGATPPPSPVTLPAPLRQELDIPEEAVLIGIVSRLAVEKGHRVLLEALAQVSEQAVCIIAGSGPEEERLRSFATAQHLDARVRFLGWRQDSEAIMRALDIVVQPSLWEEAWGLAIMEAMALGKPVVATQTGGIPELIAHGQAGLLVPKHDAAALADALNALIADPALRARMGQAGQERQRARFSLEALAANTEAVYADLLASPTL